MENGFTHEVPKWQVMTYGKSPENIVNELADKNRKIESMMYIYDNL